MKIVFAVSSKKTDGDQTFSQWLVLVLLAMIYLSHGQDVSDTSPAEDSTSPDGSAIIPTTALVVENSPSTAVPASLTDETATTSGR